jgi:tetratricopeptide (TPR) repeat protein
MQRMDEAEATQRRALSLLGPDSLNHWVIMHDLGRTLLQQGRPEEALSLFQEALAGLRGTNGERIAKRNIGTTLIELERFEEARDCLEELLADQEAQGVPDEGFIAWVVRPLGSAYRALGDPRAEEMFQRLAELDQPWVL